MIKFKAVLFSGTFFIFNFAHANSVLDTAIVNGIQNDHQILLNKNETSLMPDKIQCKKLDNQAVDISEIKSNKAQMNLGDDSNYDVKIYTNLFEKTLILDWSDGDQVGGILLSRQDLSALSSGEVKAIEAIQYGGYSWNGDDYLKYSASICTLP